MEKNYLTIAVDFDGTLVANKYPNIGEPLQGFAFTKTLIDELKLLRANGHKVILWTCRSGLLLKEAVSFCKEQGLEFDAINDNLEEDKEFWKDSIEWSIDNGKARKIYADIYIDDRALSVDFQSCLSTYLGEVCK